jgi:hypothetical protein
MHHRAASWATLGILIFATIALFPLHAAEPKNEAPAASVSSVQPLLIVVTPRQFEKELVPFIEHKQKDLSVEVAALETILAQNPGVDDPEKLKHFLYRAWRERQARYVLLVGDAEVMPVRYMVLDRITPKAFDYAFYPSDLYYGDVARADGSFDDWNAQKDGYHAQYFGEVRGEKNKTDPMNFDGIHYRPELAVGRWPVNTPEQVRTVAAKTIRFENRIAAQPSSACRAALICNSGWIDARDAMDREAQWLPQGWKYEKRYYSNRRSRSNMPPPNYQEVLCLLNEGVDLMLHAGHGQDDQWEQSLHLRDLQKIKNADHLPVIMSIGCNTGRFATLPPYEPYLDVHGVAHKGTYVGEAFDAPPPPPVVYAKEKYNTLGLGKQLVSAGPNGAVAYIGCNTGGQPCAVTLMDGFTKAWGKSPSARLGDCWKDAVAYYYEEQHLDTLRPDRGWYSASIFFQAMKYMVYGDPSLRLPH